MSKLYALFPDEHMAKKAISEIEKESKSAKINLFSPELEPIENSIYLSADKIIGSPSGMVSPFFAKNYLSETSAAQPELSAFVYADFSATYENSLAQNAQDEIPIPSDSYGAGLKIIISASDKEKIKELLLKQGAAII